MLDELKTLCLNFFTDVLYIFPNVTIKCPKLATGSVYSKKGQICSFKKLF